MEVGMRAYYFTAICAICGITILVHATAARASLLSYDPVSGKYFEPVLVPSGITWNDAEADAVAAGGYLACPTDSEINAFVFSLVDNPAYWTPRSINSDISGPWLGAYANNDFNGGDATFTWVNGAPFVYAPWASGQPDGYPGNIPQQAVVYYDFASIGSTWGDAPQDGEPGYSLQQGYVIEFDSVPEPSTFGLLGAGSLVLIRRRRR
jgi:hypothetical protein